METLSKEEIIKQAKKVENYQGNESDIVGAEKSGKYHGFIAGAEWATSQLQADKAELLKALEIFIEQNTPTFTSHDYEFPEHVMKVKSLIQKHKK